MIIADTAAGIESKAELALIPGAPISYGSDGVTVLASTAPMRPWRLPPRSPLACRIIFGSWKISSDWSTFNGCP